MIKTVRKTGVTSTEKSKATISLIHLKLTDTGACKMNETKHIIYESLFLYNTRATHQHFHNYCSRILSSKTGMASWDNSRQNEMQIFEIRQKLSEQEQKTAPSLYFRADFNNSPTILTRIVSQIHTCFRNKNRTSVARTAPILVWVIEFSRQTQ